MTATTTGGFTNRLELARGHEIPAFLNDRGDAVFACLHAPRGTVSGLVVICSSIGAEWKYNYRREVILGRLLSASGIAAVRFHYLGTGHSDDGDADVHRMVRDARTAERWAAETAGFDGPTVYFGAKFGAFVAALAGRERSSPLLVWNPPATGEQYFRGLFRVARAGNVSGWRTAPVAVASEADPRAELAAGRTADIIGYPLSAALYDSARELALADTVGDGRRVHITSISDTAPDTAALGRLTETSCRTTTSWVHEGASWWLHSPDRTPEENRASVQTLLADAVDTVRAFGKVAR